MLNVSQAAIACGKSRTTIYRHIKAGKLSATPDPDGGYVIDPAELLRVYGPLKASPERPPERSTEHHVAPSTPPETVTVTRAEYDAMREAMAKLPLVEANLNDLRRMLPAAPHEAKPAPAAEATPDAGRIRKAWNALRGR